MPSNGFTDQAQEALRTAQEIVQQKHHAQLDVEHILLALLKAREGEIVGLIESLGSDPVMLVSWVEDQVNTQPQSSGQGRGPASLHVSARAQQVISAAAGEAGKA